MYNFSEHFKRGDIIYQVRYIERSGLQEVNKLELGTVSNSYIIGSKEKSNSFMIGRDQIEKNLIFRNPKEAHARLKELSKNMKQVTNPDIPEQLVEEFEEEESEDNLDSYIDGDGEDE
jgi:hypothetical protein